MFGAQEGGQWGSQSACRIRHLAGVVMTVARADVLVCTLGSMVKHPGLGCVGAGPPGVSQSVREVGFLEVEEECWIKTPDGVERSYPDEQARTGDPVDGPGDIGEVSALVPANDWFDKGPSW